MLGECNEKIRVLKLHVGKEIYIDVYNNTFYHNHNKIALQIVILIRKNKPYCVDFYLNGQFLK